MMSMESYAPQSHYDRIAVSTDSSVGHFLTRPNPKKVRYIKIRGFFLRLETHPDTGASPSQTAIELARTFVDLTFARGFVPQSIGVSAEGGILLEYLLPEHRYLIECYNDGDVVFLHETNGCKVVSDLPKSEFEDAANLIVTTPFQAVRVPWNTEASSYERQTR
jgi:hypothetical protein